MTATISAAAPPKPGPRQPQTRSGNMPKRRTTSRALMRRWQSAGPPPPPCRQPRKAVRPRPYRSRLDLTSARAWPHRSDPAASLEIKIWADRAYEHQRERDRIAPMPAELRHVAKVHAENAGDQRRRQEDHGRP